MLSKPIPLWILVGGFVLALIAGCVNTIGFLGMNHQAISHMSGPITLVGNDLAEGQLNLAVSAGAVVLSFFGGCVVSAMIIRKSALKLGRRYGVTLVLESVVLLLAWWLLRNHLWFGACAAAVACGLQNAMATSYSGAVVRTTHMTGIITDLGIATGSLLRGDPVDGRRVGLYLTLLAGFFSGSVLGGVGYLSFGFDVLLIPALVTGLSGSVYFGYYHFGPPGTAAGETTEQRSPR